MEARKADLLRRVGELEQQNLQVLPCLYLVYDIIMVWMECMDCTRLRAIEEIPGVIFTIPLIHSVSSHSIYVASILLFAGPGRSQAAD